MLNESRIIDMIIGAIMFGAGLLFLMEQYASADQLVTIASHAQTETENLYQQGNKKNINYISDCELYTIIMAYREYPIIVDGNVIKTDETDYEYCFSLVRNGYYEKSYEYDQHREIVRIKYTYINRI